MSKMLIRQIEEELPTISASIAKMGPLEKLSIYLIYIHAKKLFSTIESCTRILDIGCGDGLILNEISNELNSDNREYVGIDISVKKLRYAHSRSKQLCICEKTNFVLADAEYLPFKPLTFDTALLIEVLEHFSNPVLFVSELVKVIISSGKVVITTPSAYGAKGSKLPILQLLRWSMKQKEPAFRERFIIVQGKRLPHRDFTLAEINDLMCSNFVLTSFYSFNFGVQYLVKRLLPSRFLVWATIFIENKATIFPCTWGHNWVILCEKK